MSGLKVVITGASSGIGRALAVEYARRGAMLALIARRQEILDQLAASLPARSFCYAADVRDPIALAQGASDFIARAGCPDIVIANAGVSAGTLTGAAEDNEVFEEILATNVTGMMLTFQPYHRGDAGTRLGSARRHCQCRRISRVARRGSVFGVQSRGH